MRLMNIEIEGYRRFEAPITIDVAGDVVAFVGPNEAGKTSLLESLQWLTNDDALERRDRTRETGAGRRPDATRVKASFLLDPEDTGALKGILGATKVRSWTYELQDDKLTCELKPVPWRDLTPRRRTASKLEKYAAREKLAELSPIADVDIDPLYDAAVAVLRSDKDSLTNQDLAALQEFANAVKPAGDGPVGEALSKEFHAFLDELRSYNEGPSPYSRAHVILKQRTPRFLLFSDEDRDLQRSYDLEQEFPRALENLAFLAKLDLARLVRAIREDDTGRREMLVKDANKVLEDVFKASWRQSDVTVHLAVQQLRLQIFASVPGSGEVIPIDERSAGMRWFVALRAFMEKHALQVKPILLVDEAETHLHYDAQADLIQVFTDQTLASKIIYTTHSAGCLPRDLGTGIRAVVPVSAERSTVRNSIWHGGEFGFTPLVYAMGATSFAFLPARYALIGEGITDAMLYPTLFREATRSRTLDFQTTLGLAVAGRDRMLGLITQAGSVCFIMDGDDDGDRYRQDLLDAGVPTKRIFCLAEACGVGATLEDLVKRDLYVQAVNAILVRYQNTALKFPLDQLPETGRSIMVAQWCRNEGLNPPDKRKIVQELLDVKSAAAKNDKPIELLAPVHRKEVARLYRAIRTALHS